MPFNDTYANKILSWTLGKGSADLAQLSKVYIGMSSNDPEADGGVFTELSGDTYSRVLIAQAGESYPDVIGNAEGREIKNVKQINWTKAKDANWTTAQGFGLFTSETGGSPYFYGKLENPLSVVKGSVALFDPEALKISFPTSDVSATAQ